MHIKFSIYFQRTNVIKAEHDIILQLYITKLSKLKLNKAPQHRKKFSASLRVTETMKIAWLSDQNLVTNPQCYKDRQNRSSLLSISMNITLIEIKRLI